MFERPEVTKILNSNPFFSVKLTDYDINGNGFDAKQCCFLEIGPSFSEFENCLIGLSFSDRGCIPYLLDIGLVKQIIAQTRKLSNLATIRE